MDDQIIEVPGHGQVAFPSTMSDADIVSAIKKLSRPTNTAVALNASSKAIAALPDMFLNAPQHLMNLGRAAVGTATNLVGRPDLSPEIVPAPNYANRLLSRFGAIRPENEPQTPGQRILDAAVQGGVGMLANPTSSIGGAMRNVALGATGGLASGATTEATGSPLAGIVAGMATPVAAQVAGSFGRARVNDAIARRVASGESVNDATMAAAGRLGFVVPPSEFNRGSVINNVLESFGGKAALKQESSIRNQDVTNRAARQELNLPEGTAITSRVLRDYRQREAQPYRDVIALSPRAAQVFDNLQNTREQMQAAWREYNGPNHPRQALADARALTQQSQQLENNLEQIAVQHGRPDLVPSLRESRINIAKSHDIENAMNVGNADISARILGRQLDRTGDRMTGNLRTVGAFAEGPGAKFTQEGAVAPSPGVSATNVMAGGLLATLGHQYAGLPGLLAGTLPFASEPIRNLVLSRPYQNLMNSPANDAGLLSRSFSSIENLSPQERMLEALLIARSQADAKNTPMLLE